MVKSKTGWLMVLSLLVMGQLGYGQSDVCPANINFATGDLTNWSVSTGLVGGSSQSYSKPNIGLVTVPEYSFSTPGIRVISSSTSDKFGGFPTIPVINGYAYTNSVLLGSTATSHDLNSASRTPGGFTRAITYTIAVPSGSSAEPYTISYAYALVLENGTHNSNQQPLFKATLQTADGIISCASPQYYLPTLNDAHSSGGPGGGGASRGATLDSATALANGFVNSPQFFFSYSGQDDNGGTSLRDVWTKDWTEVTVDLAAYRGQEVRLTFEVDNCVPGAHFAYAYIALRNSCAGPQISGFATACTNSRTIYTIPGLPQATYTWTVPDGWTILSGDNTNTIKVRPGVNSGSIGVHQVNGCANLNATLPVTTSPGTIAGQVGSSDTICAGTNNTPLTLTGNRGKVLNWFSSIDGVEWKSLGVSGNQYQARNLNASTQYVALVQNGDACSIDTSAAALIHVDPLTAGGVLSPANTDVCEGQNISPALSLITYTGVVENWQQSSDSIVWTGISPVYQQTSYNAHINSSTNFYRAIVKSGVCPVDTSTVAAVRFYKTLFPEAVVSPDSFSVCYGQPVQLTATIATGTRYVWSSAAVSLPGSNGIISRVPQLITLDLTPFATTHTVLSVYNDGCPNPVQDTAFIAVAPRVIVSAGNDTAVVVGQSLKLLAFSNVDEAPGYVWWPASGLNDPFIKDPVAVYSKGDPASITYKVTATTAQGCSGSDFMTVRLFKTSADIFIPNAFTPNHDGRNDVLRPVYAGIVSLQYFRIYNRWGQLIFSTADMSKGWDGTFAGNPQGTESFVYIVQAKDYTGRIINKKGNTTLIR